MSNTRNKELLTPKPLAPRHWEAVAARGAEARTFRREDEENRIYKNRKRALGAIAVAIMVAGAAGGGRNLVQDTEHVARATVESAVGQANKISDAFANPGEVTGQPDTSEEAYHVNANEARNLVIEEAQASQVQDGHLSK